MWIALDSLWQLRNALENAKTEEKWVLEEMKSVCVCTLLAVFCSGRGELASSFFFSSLIPPAEACTAHGTQRFQTCINKLKKGQTFSSQGLHRFPYIIRIKSDGLTEGLAGLQGKTDIPDILPHSWHLNMFPLVQTECKGCLLCCETHAALERVA